MRTRVKICGIARVQDAVRAVELGVDALGLVFYSGSVRAVTPEAAVKIITATAPFVTIVGLFLNADPQYVKSIVDSVGLDLLQFHGTETPQECAAYRRPFIKAVPMSGPIDIQEYVAAYPDATGFLFDSHSPGKRGGLGRSFDWSRIPGHLGKPLILAGGLTPQNVGDAIRATTPYAVDVSSGVEANKGSKDPAKMAAFMQEVHRVDCSTS